MHAIKRYLSATLAILLLVFAVSAFAEGEDPMAKYDEMITITTCRSIGDTVQTYIDKKDDVLTDNIWFNSYRDELGINVEYVWTAPSAQYEEKMNAQIAANDLPDFMNVNANQLKQLVDYGMAYDMTEIFEQYATPFTMEMMEADMNVALDQATFDGRLMALPQVNGNRDGSNFWWIRFDWLENLGLEEPKTLDELVAVMYAFAQNDPDGNGENDTFGTLIQRWEEEEPIPEPDEKWRDADGIKKYISTWFFGHLAKMFKVENDWSAEYEKALEPYTAHPPSYDGDFNITGDGGEAELEADHGGE